MDETLDYTDINKQAIHSKYIRKKSLAVEVLDCSDCALVIEHRLERLEGVLEVRVDYIAQKVLVHYDSRLISLRAIKRRIRQLGYDIVPGEFGRWYRTSRELIFSLLAGISLLVGWLGGQFLGFPQILSGALYLSAYVFAGYDVGRHAVDSLRRRKFDTDVLMLAAAIGAASLGEFAEGGLLLFLFSLGHALEDRALDKARVAVRSLADLAPKTALVSREGRDARLPVEQLVLDDLVIIRPGERVPVDGEVEAGRSSVDQSPVTGESLPVEKAPGERVFAGSLNGEGALKVRVNRLARDSTLARTMRMVEKAQAAKSPTQLSVDRFTRILVPLVLVTVLLLILLPPMFGVPFRDSFERAMTLLVATSPCALALGTPSAILAGVARAARNGVLIKGGVYLEDLGQLRAIAFDKTGTLTTGEPHVTDVIPLAGWSGDDILGIAAALESQSRHPLAQAVVHEAAQRGVPRREANEVEAQTGLGMRAIMDGKITWIGNHRLLHQAGLTISEDSIVQMEHLEGQGKSVVLVTYDGEIIGLIAISDVIRSDAPGALTELENLGLRRTVMLSGDNPRAAAYIAGQVGIPEYRAELMPGDKLTALNELIREYDRVGMVGDGVNDAPALARATVGIAMGSAGSDIALETADVALMSSDLNKLPFVVGLGRFTRLVILSNLILSLVVMAVLGGLALSGLAGIGMAVLIHEGSTLLVVANSLRLLNYS